MTAIISIRAKFRKTFVITEDLACLPLTRKYSYNARSFAE